MSLDFSSNTSIRNQWAREHAIRGIKELLNKKILESPDPSGIRPFLPDGPLPPLPKPQPLNDDSSDDSSDDSDDSDGSSKKIKDAKIAIVGAGAAGLFTAMILDYLNNNEDLKHQDFNISYDIFEAADKDRIGGRLFTYNFVAQDARNPCGQHDYYDVGAMRFPENKVMTRYISSLMKLFQLRIAHV